MLNNQYMSKTKIYLKEGEYYDKIIKASKHQSKKRRSNYGKRKKNSLQSP